MDDAIFRDFRGLAGLEVSFGIEPLYERFADLC